jgi:hypothetical protein
VLQKIIKEAEKQGLVTIDKEKLYPVISLVRKKDTWTTLIQDIRNPSVSSQEFTLRRDILFKENLE